MTVPPPVVVANQVQLAALVATNVLGQNTPAIAATETDYAEMWAQDTAAMYGYAGSSASAGKLVPMSDPASTTNPGGLGGQAAAVAHAAGTTGTSAGLPGLVSGLPGAMQSLSNPVSAAAAPAQALDDFFGNDLVVAIPNGIIDMGAWNLFNGITTGVLYAHTADAGLSVIAPSLTAVWVSRAGKLAPQRVLRASVERRYWRGWAKRPRWASYRCRRVGPRPPRLSPLPHRWRARGGLPPPKKAAA